MNRVIAKELFNGFNVYEYDYFITELPAFTNSSDPTKTLVRPTMARKVAASGRSLEIDEVCIYNKDFEESYIDKQVVSELMADFGNIILDEENGLNLRVKLEIQTEKDSPKYFYPIIIKDAYSQFGYENLRETGNRDERIMAPEYQSQYFGMVLGKDFQNEFEGPWR